MKFKTKTDEVQYRILGLNEVEVRKRLTLARQYAPKDRKKSRNMKDNWRRKKHELIKGIKKWNASTAGKRFHRALGRFNALRESVSYYIDELTPGENYVELTMKQVNDALLSLSSIETHLFLELQYYESDPEIMTEFLDLVNVFVEDSAYLKLRLLDTFVTGKMAESDYDLLVEIIQTFQDPKMYLYAKREKEGLTNDAQQEESFKEQLSFVENIDISSPSEEIYEKIDELVENSLNRNN